ncbi:MAG: hypothetical protein U5J83_07370 [Bryobacterales bacterium]|nr:hypothetical protein [Bryobacterales bacterium]
MGALCFASFLVYGFGATALGSLGGIGLLIVAITVIARGGNA